MQASVLFEAEVASLVMINPAAQNTVKTIIEVRDDVAAIYGPVLLNLVLEYLRALEKIEVLAL